MCLSNECVIVNLILVNGLVRSVLAWLLADTVLTDRECNPQNNILRCNQSLLTDSSFGQTKNL